MLKEGKPIGAIEVFVTHRVTPEKADYLSTLGISWLEVNGTQQLYEGANIWTVETPLPFYRRHPHMETWICDRCKELTRQFEIEKARKQEEEAERTRQREIEAAIQQEEWRKWREYNDKNHVGFRQVKIVDFYYASGKKYRDLFAIKERVVNGVCVEIWLTCKDGRVLSKKEAPITEQAIKAFIATFDRVIKGREKKGVIVDSPMQWLVTAYDEYIDIYDEGAYPYRYAWWRDEARWFLPKANREINWD